VRGRASGGCRLLAAPAQRAVGGTGPAPGRRPVCRLASSGGSLAAPARRTVCGSGPTLSSAGKMTRFWRWLSGGTSSENGQRIRAGDEPTAGERARFRRLSRVRSGSGQATLRGLTPIEAAPARPGPGGGGCSRVRGRSRGAWRTAPARRAVDGCCPAPGRWPCGVTRARPAWWHRPGRISGRAPVADSEAVLVIEGAVVVLGPPRPRGGVSSLLPMPTSSSPRDTRLSEQTRASNQPFIFIIKKQRQEYERISTEESKKHEAIINERHKYCDKLL
jgi:hypothetical protein